MGTAGMPSPGHPPAAPLPAKLSLSAVRGVRRRTAARRRGVAIGAMGLRRDGGDPAGKPLAAIRQRDDGPAMRAEPGSGGLRERTIALKNVRIYP